MPILYVKDKDTLDIIRIEESFSSLVWTERYQETGDFVLDIPLSKANFDVYKRGNYVVIDESEEVMMIESLNIDDEVEEPQLEVSGRSLSLILERRINASKLLDNYAESIKYEGSLDSVISSIINDEIVSPKMQVYIWKWRDSDGNVHDGYGQAGGSEVVARWKEKKTVDASYRKISGFNYVNYANGVTVDKTYSKLSTIYDILVDLSKRYVFGFRIRFDFNGNLQLQTYKGTDRTSNQKTLDPVIFNPVMDNITYVNYFEDQTDYRNVALSYSDGVWSPVDYNASFSSSIFSGYVWVPKDENVSNESLSGLNRIELPVDARSNASVANYDPYEYLYGEDPDTGESTGSIVDEDGNPTGIVEKVKTVAEEEFDTKDYDLVKKSEGAIDPLVRYSFGTDYFLGDIIEVSNSNGVVMTAIVDEVVRSYDSEGFITTPNFTSMEDYDYGEEDE